MKGLFRKYWWLLIILIVLPGIINLCYYFPAIDAIFLEPQKWTIFWGSYIGAIVSTLVTLFVLFKQLEQNHSENEYNRKLQLSVLEYQKDMQWLNAFTSKIIDYLNAINWNEWGFIREDIIFNKDRENLRQRIRQITEKINSLDAELHVLLLNRLDDKEKSFVEKIDSYSGELWALSNDVDWYVFKDLLTRVNNGLTKEELKHIVESEYQHIPYKCKSTDISNIIEVWNYDIAKHNRDIISVRVNQALNVLSYEEIRTSIFDFLDYEKKKIESTITKSIGGEESQEKNRKKTNKSQLCNRPTKINSN